MVEVVEVLLIAGIIIFMVADRLYFALRFPECKSCGWITKENGRCKGCNGKRVYRWQ